MKCYLIGNVYELQNLSSKKEYIQPRVRPLAYYGLRAFFHAQNKTKEYVHRVFAV